MSRVVIRYGGCRPRAARAADALHQELGIQAEIRRGRIGEFSVWVDDRKVASRGLILFPTERRIVGAVRAALFYSSSG